MNNPEDKPVDIEEVRAWLKAFREQNHAYSWTTLSKLIGRPTSTLSLFLSGKYAGRNEEIAKDVFRFRQTYEMRAEAQSRVIDNPVFVETPTAARLMMLLEWAQLGRITVAAMGPGTGKTKTAEEYAARGSNVWRATMRQSTRTVAAMIAEVMPAMGIHIKSGWTAQRSAHVVDFLAGRDGLLIVDEANHLDLAAWEELRSWHDATGVGICFLGNEELVTRIKGGAHSHAYARLNSRIAKFHIQDKPTERDVDAYCDGMNVPEERAIRRLLHGAAVAPGSGGLREVKQILEAAHTLAIGADEVMGLPHIQTAIADRTTDWRRRAAA